MSPRVAAQQPVAQLVSKHVSVGNAQPLGVALHVFDDSPRVQGVRVARPESRGLGRADLAELTHGRRAVPAAEGREPVPRQREAGSGAQGRRVAGA